MNNKTQWLCTCVLLLISYRPLTAQEARMWLTTPDRSALLAEQNSPLSFTSTPNASPAIEVNDMQQFQQIDGFGFALTGGSAQ